MDQETPQQLKSRVSQHFLEEIEDYFAASTVEWVEITPDHYRLKFATPHTGGTMDFMVLLGHFNESNETTAPLSGAPADQWPVVLLYMGDVARRVDAVKLDFQHGRSVAFIGQEDKATKHLLTILDQFVEDIIGTPKQFPSPGPLEPS